MELKSGCWRSIVNDVLFKRLTTVVEKCNPVDELVFTSGYEHVIKLKPSGQLDVEFK
jgi:hypothetical protein